MKTDARGRAHPAKDPRYAPRSRQATKILAILGDFVGSDMSALTCLDIGCGTGVISRRLAGHFKSIIGMDLDDLGAVASSSQGNDYFVRADGSFIPVPDGFFDVVICAQVYEHAADPPALAGEIWRVLRPGGVCFFSGPNRLAIMEEHYWLPFLSWLPRPLASRYMRLFGRGSVYDIRPSFYWQIRRLWRAFIIQDYSVRLLQEPERFAMAERFGKLKWLSRAPGWLLRLSIPFLPNYNWILIKS